ncbi:MAG: hypothetical protein ACUZ8I_13780 [Candidatus Scalindua sp.]
MEDQSVSARLNDIVVQVLARVGMVWKVFNPCLVLFNIFHFIVFLLLCESGNNRLYFVFAETIF